MFVVQVLVRTVMFFALFVATELDGRCMLNEWMRYFNLLGKPSRKDLVVCLTDDVAHTPITEIQTEHRKIFFVLYRSVFQSVYILFACIPIELALLLFMGHGMFLGMRIYTGMGKMNENASKKFDDIVHTQVDIQREVEDLKTPVNITIGHSSDLTSAVGHSTHTSSAVGHSSDLTSAVAHSSHTGIAVAHSPNPESGDEVPNGHYIASSPPPRMTFRTHDPYAPMYRPGDRPTYPGRMMHPGYPGPGVPYPVMEHPSSRRVGPQGPYPRPRSPHPSGMGPPGSYGRPIIRRWEDVSHPMPVRRIPGESPPGPRREAPIPVRRRTNRRLVPMRRSVPRRTKPSSSREPVHRTPKDNKQS